MFTIKTATHRYRGLEKYDSVLGNHAILFTYKDTEYLVPLSSIEYIKTEDYDPIKEESAGNVVEAEGW